MVVQGGNLQGFVLMMKVLLCHSVTLCVVYLMLRTEDPEDN